MKTLVQTLVLGASAALLSACGNPDAPAGEAGNASGAKSGGMTSGCLTRSYPEIGGPISLVDDTGKAVTEADYMGKPTLVFFGFTYCPDVCPTTLVTLKRAYDRLPEGVEPPQTLLISVDPERDTPEQLAKYVSTKAFPENLTGLTGTPEQVRAAADNFIADYSRIDDPSSAAGYTMDHTALMYLMDEDWKLKTFFTHDETAESIAACLGDVLAED